MGEPQHPMDDFNPYAGPSAPRAPVDRDGQALEDVGLWRDGSTGLVMARDALLPYTCVRCGAAAEGFMLQRNLIWHRPVFYLTILLNPIVYIIVALCVLKRATIFVGLCPL